MNPGYRGCRLPYSAAILAGGRSRRMGRDKSMLEIGGVRIIRRIADILEDMFTQVFVVANERDAIRAEWALAVVSDIHPGNDSLGGLHAAVASAEGSHVFVAWDATCRCFGPRSSTAWPLWWKGWDVVIPVKDDYPEPLCAFYGRNAARLISRNPFREAA